MSRPRAGETSVPRSAPTDGQPRRWTWKYGGSTSPQTKRLYTTNEPSHAVDATTAEIADVRVAEEFGDPDERRHHYGAGEWERVVDVLAVSRELIWKDVRDGARVGCAVRGR